MRGQGDDKGLGWWCETHRVKKEVSCSTLGQWKLVKARILSDKPPLYEGQHQNLAVCLQKATQELLWMWSKALKADSLIFKHFPHGTSFVGIKDARMKSLDSSWLQKVIDAGNHVADLGFLQEGHGKPLWSYEGTAWVMAQTPRHWDTKLRCLPRTSCRVEPSREWSVTGCGAAGSESSQKLNPYTVGTEQEGLALTMLVLAFGPIFPYNAIIPSFWNGNLCSMPLYVGSM